jgi:uncharacterized RmlC-like cupin family protein
MPEKESSYFVGVSAATAFIPPDMPHEAINLSNAEPALAIVARNDPNEQERVIPYHVKPQAL